MAQTLGTTTFPQHDIYIGTNGNLVILQGQPAVQAACQSVSLLRLGEAVLSITSGIPYFQTVWIGTPNISAYENALRQAILGVDGVLAVKALTVTVSQGNLSYVATISSIYGTFEILSESVSS